MASLISSSGSFYVLDKAGNFYPATYLVDSNGNYIVDYALTNGALTGIYSSQFTTLYAGQSDTTGFQNSNGYLVVPSADITNNLADIGSWAGQSSGMALASLMPRMYGDQQFIGNSALIPATTDAGNFGVGVYAANAGYSLDATLMAFGEANVLIGGKDTSQIYGNSLHGLIEIVQGYTSASNNSNPPMSEALGNTLNNIATVYFAGGLLSDTRVSTTSTTWPANLSDLLSPSILDNAGNLLNGPSGSSYYDFGNSGYGQNGNPFSQGGVIDQGYVPQTQVNADQNSLNDFTNLNSGAFIGATDNAFQNAQTAVTSTSSFGDSSLGNNGYVTIGASAQSAGDYSYATVNASSLGISVSDSGVGAGTINGSNLTSIDAGGSTALGEVYGNPSGTFPVDVPTSIDSSAFSNAIPVTVGTDSTGNTSYATVSFASAEVPQANGMAQSAPVDTIETDAAQGDFGALAGGTLDGIAGIFGGIIDGIGGLISGIFGGGGSYGGGSYGGGSYGGGSGGGSPVVLDLSGKGIKITPLSSSNMFFGMANNGYAQHTAWAGAGNGVLVYDPSGGAVTQANQVNFTLWDPTAKTDMQALQHVFDTNHDGVLNASDSSWNNFRILVTNADGTQTLETLAQAGVTSINLNANSYKQAFTDGSSIDGETTFTKSDGTTGTAATVLRFRPVRRPCARASLKRAA